MQHLTPVLLETQPRENIQNMKPVQFSTYPVIATVQSNNHMRFKSMQFVL